MGKRAAVDVEPMRSITLNISVSKSDLLAEGISANDGTPWPVQGAPLSGQDAADFLTGLSKRVAAALSSGDASFDAKVDRKAHEMLEDQS